MITTSPFPPGARVVAYLRDSGHEEQELSTLQQERSIREWCEANQVTLTAVFKDEARPGSSVNKRTAFLEMMDHFYSPVCSDQGLVIWAFNRFARNINDAQYFKADLRRRGYTIFSLTDSIPDGPFGRAFESIIEANDQVYREKMAFDISRGLNYIVTEYKAVPGHPPPGFKREPISVGRHRDGSPRKLARWVIDEDLAPTIRAIWQMRAEGCPVESIHARYHLFNARNSYTAFFKNRLYIGELCYAGAVIPDYSPAIISMQVWDSVQRINEKYAKKNSPLADRNNPLNPRRVGSSFLLSGLLYCQRCGCIMNGKIVQGGQKKRNDYYICTGAHQNLACDARAIPREELERVVIDTLVEYIHDPEVQRLRARSSEESAARYHARLDDEIKAAKKAAAETARRIQNTTAHLADDPDAPRSLVSALHQLENEQQARSEELARLVSLSHENVRAQTSAEIAGLAEKLIRVISSENITEKKAILRLFINRVTAERDGNMLRGMTYLLSASPGEVKKKI